MKHTTKLSLSILAVFSLSLFSQMAQATVRCEKVHLYFEFADSEARAEQIVFSSQAMTPLFDQIKEMTGASSNTEALKLLKQTRPKDFKELQSRVHLASEVIETLATAHDFGKFDGRMKSLLYADVTQSVLTTTEPHGIGSFFRPDNALYFSEEYKSSDAFAMIKANSEIKEDWSVGMDTRARISEYVQKVLKHSLETEKQYTHTYTSLLVIQMTFKKGAAGIDEMAQHCQRFFKNAEEYDLSLLTTVNDLPIDELVTIQTQLTSQIPKLEALFQQATPAQRTSLQLDAALAKLHDYDDLLKKEISFYETKLKETSALARAWEVLIQQK